MLIDDRELIAVDGDTVATIDGEMARQIFFEDLPEVVSNSLLYCNIDAAEADAFVNSMEDADRRARANYYYGQLQVVRELKDALG